MYICTTEENFFKLKEELKEVSNDRFYEYFQKHYEKKFEMWTSINRNSTFSLYNTNNVSETLFKQFQCFIHNKVQSLSDMIKKIDKFLRHVVMKKDIKGLSLYFLFSLNREIKWLSSKGISSLRSRRGGMRIGITLRR